LSVCPFSDIFQSSLMSLDGARVSKMRANDRLTQPASIGSGNPLSSTPTNPMKPKASYVCLVSYTHINCLCLCRQTVCERSIFFFFLVRKKKELMGHAWRSNKSRLRSLKLTISPILKLFRASSFIGCMCRFSGDSQTIRLNGDISISKFDYNFELMQPDATLFFCFMFD
jgi:hypothetical protein